MKKFYSCAGMYFKDINFEVKNVKVVNAPKNWFGPCGLTAKDMTFFKVEAVIEGVNVRTIMPINNNIAEGIELFDMKNLKGKIFDLMKYCGRFDPRCWEIIE